MSDLGGGESLACMPSTPVGRPGLLSPPLLMARQHDIRNQQAMELTGRRKGGGCCESGKNTNKHYIGITTSI